MIRVGFVRRAILDIRNEGARGAPWALAALLFPTLIKFGLDTGLAGSPPFLTYFPALTIAAVFLGPSWGMAVAVTSAVLANYLFMERRFDWARSPDALVVTGIYLVGAVMIIATAAGLKRAVALQASPERWWAIISAPGRRSSIKRSTSSWRRPRWRRSSVRRGSGCHFEEVAHSTSNSRGAGS